MDVLALLLQSPTLLPALGTLGAIAASTVAMLIRIGNRSLRLDTEMNYYLHPEHARWMVWSSAPSWKQVFVPILQAIDGVSVICPEASDSSPPPEKEWREQADCLLIIDGISGEPDDLKTDWSHIVSLTLCDPQSCNGSSEGYQKNVVIRLTHQKRDTFKALREMIHLAYPAYHDVRTPPAYSDVGISHH